MRLWLALVWFSACALAGCDSMRGQALAGHGADVGTTAVGLAMGAAEANPLGVAAVGLKAVAYQHIERQSAVEQPRLWGMYGALGWGAAANNLCVIAGISTGGVALGVCPVLGVAAGLSLYRAAEDRRNREIFDAVCAEQRATNPELVCVYGREGL